MNFDHRNHWPLRNSEAADEYDEQDTKMGKITAQQGPENKCNRDKNQNLLLVLLISLLHLVNGPDLSIVALQKFPLIIAQLFDFAEEVEVLT